MGSIKSTRDRIGALALITLFLSGCAPSLGGELPTPNLRDSGVNPDLTKAAGQIAEVILEGAMNAEEESLDPQVSLPFSVVGTVFDPGVANSHDRTILVDLVYAPAVLVRGERATDDGSFSFDFSEEEVGDCSTLAIQFHARDGRVHREMLGSCEDHAVNYRFPASR